VRFAFRGKHGKLFEAEFSDRRVAAVLRRLEGLPGQHLFQFVDEAGAAHRVTSDDINAYIREATGGDFTAKDFRTWAATVLAVIELSQLETATGETAKKRGLAKAIKQVAARLGNTPTVCRSSYVHPEVLASYLDGTLPVQKALVEESADANGIGLTSNERAVLRFLRRRINQKEQQTEEAAPKPAVAKSLATSVASQAV
jgi:DNA topoisomerase-1